MRIYPHCSILGEPSPSHDQVPSTIKTVFPLWVFLSVIHNLYYYTVIFKNPHQKTARLKTLQWLLITHSLYPNSQTKIWQDFKWLRLRLPLQSLFLFLNLSIPQKCGTPLNFLCIFFSLEAVIHAILYAGTFSPSLPSHSLFLLDKSDSLGISLDVSDVTDYDYHHELAIINHVSDKILFSEKIPFIVLNSILASYFNWLPLWYFTWSFEVLFNLIFKTI